MACDSAGRVLELTVLLDDGEVRELDPFLLQGANRCAVQVVLIEQSIAPTSGSEGVQVTVTGSLDGRFWSPLGTPDINTYDNVAPYGALAASIGWYDTPLAALEWARLIVRNNNETPGARVLLHVSARPYVAQIM